MTVRIGGALLTGVESAGQGSFRAGGEVGGAAMNAGRGSAVCVATAGVAARCSCWSSTWRATVVVSAWRLQRPDCAGNTGWKGRVGTTNSAWGGHRPSNGRAAPPEEAYLQSGQQGESLRERRDTWSWQCCGLSGRGRGRGCSRVGFRSGPLHIGRSQRRSGRGRLGNPVVCGTRVALAACQTRPFRRVALLVRPRWLRGWLGRPWRKACSTTRFAINAELGHDWLVFRQGKPRRWMLGATRHDKRNDKRQP